MGKVERVKVNQDDPSMKSRFDQVLRTLTALLPAAAAAYTAGTDGGAAHDAEIVRTVGAGYAGIFRTLDMLLAAPAMFLPLGTRMARAALVGALASALCGALLFDIARDLARPLLLRRPKGEAPRSVGADRLVSAVASVAVLSALLSPAWQTEASSPGGSALGATLVVVALYASRAKPFRGPLVFFTLGLAASYEPLVFAAALLAAAPGAFEAWQASTRTRVPEENVGASRGLKEGLAFALGLCPLAIGALASMRRGDIRVDVPRMTLLEHGSPVALKAFFSAEFGPILQWVVAGGLALSLVLPSKRRDALPLVGIAALGMLALVAHVPAGPSRYAAPILAGHLALSVLSAPLLSALVFLVARARIPFAEHSAALILLIELALPFRAWDDATARLEGRDALASAIWNDLAWGSVPAGAVVLVSDKGTMKRIASARAIGHMRGDLLVVPTYDIQGQRGRAALAEEPKLAPLFRDIALGIAPEELSLAQLSAHRSVVLSFDPTWDRVLSRHLVPVGLSSRFEPEPRGMLERQAALEEFLPAKERLLRASVERRDTELASATATLLRARAVGMAATGERDALGRALEDLRAFAPDDAVGRALVRRTLTSRGPIDVRDLPL